MVTGLESLANRVLRNVWGAILKVCPEQEMALDSHTHETSQHESFVERESARFVGRKNVLKQCAKGLEAKENRVLLLHGKAGTGKTALMVRLLLLIKKISNNLLLKIN